MKSNKAVMGLVDTHAQAETIVSALRAEGFTNDDISALFPDTKGTRDFAHENHTKAPEGAALGASAGGFAGGTLGLLAGIGAIAIPGLGALVAAGPIIAALSGAAAGAAVGGLAGALVGLGMPEVQAKLYEGKIKSGNILIAVHTEDRERRATAKKTFETGGARDIAVIGEDRVSPRVERSMIR
jgi:hypothetical protein